MTNVGVVIGVKLEAGVGVEEAVEVGVAERVAVAVGVRVAGAGEGVAGERGTIGGPIGRIHPTTKVPTRIIPNAVENIFLKFTSTSK